MTIERLAGGIGAAVTGIICIGFAFEVLRRCRLRLRGIRTTAELVRFRTETAEDGSPTYYPVVVFTLPDGTEMTAEAGDGIPYPPLGSKEGDRTEVIYDPAAPSSINLPSLLPGRLKTSEILGLGAGCIGLAFATWLILAETF